jgi:hypothetical protein
MQDVDKLIDKLRSEHYNRITADMQFSNMYKLDENYTYKVDKKSKKVVASYKEITYTFDLPIIPIVLAPPISYLFFFRKRYTHNVVDTFKLEYKLALHYIITLQTYIKYKDNAK